MNNELIAALRPFAETEECGIGVMIEEGNEPHNSGCEECRNVLAARAAIKRATGVSEICDAPLEPQAK
jgi:hypothetical protein